MSRLERSVILAGFGGQGLLFAGEVLARAALRQGLEVMWIPSYGPEMRGGTASCTVIFSDEQIGSPVLDTVDGAIVLNPPSLARFEPMVARGGVIVVNDSLIEAEVGRRDLRVVRVGCTAEARRCGDERLTCMVGLGALIAPLGVIEPESVRASLREMLERKGSALAEVNLRAFDAQLAVATFA